MEPKQTPPERAVTQTSSSLHYAVGTVWDGLVSLKVSPFIRGQALLDVGELQRAVNCFSSSKDPRAVNILEKIATSPYNQYSLKSSALNGIGDIATHSKEAAIVATTTLFNLIKQDRTTLPEVILMRTLSLIKDPEVHTRISKMAIAEYCFRDGSGWHFNDSNNCGTFCNIASGLRDLSSAVVLGSLLCNSSNGIDQGSILGAIEARPADEVLADSLRKVMRRGESEHVVSIVGGVSAACHEVLLKKYLKS